MWLHIAAELTLALCCFAVGWMALRQRSLLAVLGFSLIGIAALLGALNYAGLQGSAGAHSLVTFLAARLALVLIAGKSIADRRRTLLVSLAGVVALLSPDKVGLAISVLALLAIAWKGRSQSWPLAISGSLLFALAGLLIGTQGIWLQVPRVDIYHFSLAAAVCVWSFAGVCKTSLRAL